MKNFQIRSKIINGVAVLYPKGHLDAHQVARFEKEIVRLIRENNVKILINGQELNYITSAGMGMIMGYIDEVREKARRHQTVRAQRARLRNLRPDRLHQDLRFSQR